MHVFLDTNILLSLYKLSGPDLDELKKIIKLAEAGKLIVHINEHVCDEYWRNRESVIKQSLDQFAAIKSSQTIPNLIAPYPKSEQLRSALKTASALVKELKEQADADVRENKLAADKLIEELFSKSPPKTIPEDLIRRAERRRTLGNPPGKNNSIGDAINWEWLLDAFPKSEDLHLVSGDGDFASDLHSSELKEFLQREWSMAKESSVFLHTSLPRFLQQQFPEIKLADEIEKSFAIEKLEQAWNFAATHDAISGLNQYVDFTEDQLLRLLKAYTENTQVFWILGDEDVLQFAEKLLSMAKSPALAEKAALLQAKVEAKREKAKKASNPWAVAFATDGE